MSAPLPPALPPSGSALEPYQPLRPPAAALRAAGGDDDSSEGGGQVARLLSALNRYKWLTVLLLAIGTGGGVLASKLVTPSYRVESTVLLTGGGGESGPLRDQSLLGAQGWIDLLKSFAIADSVVTQLALYIEPESAKDSVIFRNFQLDRSKERFIPGDYTLEVVGPRWTLRDKIGLVTEQGIVGDSIGRPASFAWAPTRAMIGGDRTIKFRVRVPREVSIDIVSKRLGVVLLQGSNLISLSLSGKAVQKPAETLNAWGEQFERIAKELKTRQLDQAERILASRKSEAEQQVNDAARQLQQFRVSAIALPSEGMAGKPTAGGGLELQNPVFDSYFQERIALRAVQRDREALERLATQLSPTSTPIEALLSIPAVASDPAAGTLRESLGELAKRQVELRILRERFLNDTLTPIRNALAGLRQLQGQVIPQQLATLRSELGQKEAAIASSLGKQTAELQGIPSRTIQQEALRRELDNASAVYSNLQARYSEAQLAKQSAVPDVRILDRAVMPMAPSENTAPSIILMGIGAGLGLGVGLALLLDRMDRRFRYPTQATKDLGLQILGVVPMVDQTRRASAEKVANVVESFRSLRMNVRYACMPAQQVTLAITSPGPGDGKSLVASNLALSFAEGGWRTLLIDADLRRGYLNETFGLPGTPGLIEYLEGSSSVEDVVFETSHVNLSMIPGGTRHRRAPELLATPRLRELITVLGRRYDAIIVDTPPLGAGTDAYAIATATTHVAIVLRGGTTDVKMAKAKLETLDRLPVHAIGAILNGVATDDAVYQYYAYDASYAVIEGGGAGTEPELARLGPPDDGDDASEPDGRNGQRDR